MKRAGRPAKSPIQMLRTRAWFRTVLVQSGGLAASRIEAKVTGRGESDDGILRLRTYENYRAGRRVAIDANVALIEAVYPGTRRYFDSPLWAVLEGRSSPADVSAQFQTLDEPIQEVLERAPRSKPFWLLHRMSMLSELSTFDALTARVLHLQLIRNIDEIFIRSAVRDSVVASRLVDGALGVQLSEEVLVFVRRWAMAIPGMLPPSS